MSQFCGSGLASRCGVTSAALTNEVPASSAPATAVRTDVAFIVTSRFASAVSDAPQVFSQPEHEQHGLVALFPELGRKSKLPDGDRAQASQDRDILLAVDLERH